MIATSIIQPIHYTSLFYRKLRRPRSGIKHHYYLMKIFKALGEKYLVDIAYPNPLASEKKLKLRLDLCQNTQQWIYRSRGNYELAWLRLIDAIMAEVDCFVDVGAHVGLFALTIGQVWPEKKVIAIEAVPENLRLLENNVRLNDLANITVAGRAITGQAGKARFFNNPINDGGGSLVPMTCYETGGIRLDAKSYRDRSPRFQSYQEVEGTPLDDFISEKSVLKIDCEGAEWEVLESAKKSFASGLVDMVVVEVAPKVTLKTLEWFAQKGFDCFTIGDKNPIRPSGPLGPTVGFGGRIYIALRKGSAAYQKVTAIL